MAWILQLLDLERAAVSCCANWRVVCSSVGGVTFASPVTLDSLPPAHHCSPEA